MPETRYYASTPRRLMWLTLALLLGYATLHYFQQQMWVIGALYGVWGLFALSWVVHLFVTPIAVVGEGRVVVLERLRFGRPNWLALHPGEVHAVQPGRRRGRVDLNLGELGDRTVNLKYLRAADRAAVMAALRGLGATQT